MFGGPGKKKKPCMNRTCMNQSENKEVLSKLKKAPINSKKLPMPLTDVSNTYNEGKYIFFLPFQSVSTVIITVYAGRCMIQNKGEKMPTEIIKQVCKLCKYVGQSHSYIYT